MNFANEFRKLGEKQLGLQGAIDLLTQVQNELGQAKASADKWGMVAVMSNVTLIPLNAIINSFQLSAAKSVYQELVRKLYGKFSQSGTRVDGHGKLLLSVTKEAIVSELKRKGLTAHVPGVNILVGLAEDSLAAWQAIQMVESGNREMNARAAAIERQIAQARMQLQKLRIQHAELLDKADIYSRTA
jgi:hypothetical protein